jgi:hypothetical protein
LDGHPAQRQPSEHELVPRSSYRVEYKGGREIHFYFSAKIGEDGFFWMYKGRGISMVEEEDVRLFQ